MTLSIEVGSEPIPGYRLVRFLGRGGFGEVWEATAPGQMPVALKFILLDDRRAEIEERSLAILRSIRHPHLLDVQFAVQQEDFLIVGMPLCERTLFDRLVECRREGRAGLPRDELMGFMAELAEAVDFLNETRHPDGSGNLVGVQHRDIKPHNAFLVGGSVRLADFGLAKALGPESASHSGSMTLAYAAPEAIEGRLGHRSDQYSLAASYCELRCGRRAFETKADGHLLYQILYGEPDLSSLPPGEWPIVARALSKNPDDRWPSCAEFVRQLRNGDPFELASGTKAIDRLSSTEPASSETRPPFGLTGRSPATALPAGTPVRQDVDAAQMTSGEIPMGTTRVDRAEAPTVRPKPVRRKYSGAAAVAAISAIAIALLTWMVVPRPARNRATTPRSGSLATTALNPAPPSLPPPTAARVQQIFRDRCLACHGGGKANGGVRILDRDALIKKKKIVPDRPYESLLYLVVSAEDDTVMPPPDEPRLAAGEVEAIRAWIADGAPALPLPPPPPPRSAVPILEAILSDVRSLPPSERPFVRYFSIDHLRVGGATDDELELYRDALAKAINHLTWKKEPVHPRLLGPNRTISRVDLRELGWDHRPFGPSKLNLFDLALLEYPYGIAQESSEIFDRLATEFLGPAGQVRPVPYVRGDWFAAVATQPPLYDDFLQLPRNLKALEDRLGVDVAGDLENGQARRAGLVVSGVSKNNRALERHLSRDGSYWKSLDFRSSKAEENLFRDPMGLAPAGMEVIFSLPNGLQGYFLANAEGVRLDSAPTEIVADRNAADHVVRNGLSCLRCHDEGMKGFADAVRPAVEKLPDSPGFDRARVLRTYPPQAEMDRLLEADAGRFRDALTRVLGHVPSREPLTPVSRRFLDAPLNLAEAAAELGSPNPDGLRSACAAGPLAALGLSALASGGQVRRDAWEHAFDHVVRHLGLGEPIVPLDGLTRRDFRPNSTHLDVVLKTNHPNGIFTPGDELVITVSNPTGKPLHVELIGTDARGRRVLLTPSPISIQAGHTYRYPERGAIQIRPQAGREQITLFASDQPFPPGELLLGKEVADRVVHPHPTDRRGEVSFDPVHIMKKTIDIETR